VGDSLEPKIPEFRKPSDLWGKAGNCIKLSWHGGDKSRQKMKKTLKVTGQHRLNQEQSFGGIKIQGNYSMAERRQVHNEEGKKKRKKNRKAKMT